MYLSIFEMQAVDSIGVVRDTKRLRASGQRRRLEEDGCRVIFELGTKAKQYSRSELELLVRHGTVIKLLHVYLLAEPKAQHKKGGCRADLLATMKRIEHRGGVIKDVDSGLDTGNPEHRYDIIALAADQIARGGRVQRDGLGRPARKFTEAQETAAKLVWLDRRKYPEWSDCRQALPKGFSPARAYKLWGRRT